MNASVPSRGSILKAGLMGGAIAALLHATPYITKLNGCCCALTVVAGLFAAWIVQADSDRMAGVGRCGVAGAFAGLLGGLMGVPLAAIVSRLAFGAGSLEAQAETTMAQVRQVMATWGSAPGSEEMAESVVRAMLGLEFSVWTIFVLIVTALAFSFFGLLGGLLGGVLMRPTSSIGRGGVPTPPPRSPMRPPPPLGPRGGGAPEPTQSSDAEHEALHEEPLEGPPSADDGPLSHDELPLLPTEGEPEDEPPDRL